VGGANANHVSDVVLEPFIRTMQEKRSKLNHSPG
jgi:hypothetical protein